MSLAGFCEQFQWHSTTEGAAWSTQGVCVCWFLLPPMWGDPHSNLLPRRCRALKGQPAKQQQYCTKSLKQILFYFSDTEIKHTLNSARLRTFRTPFKAGKAFLYYGESTWQTESTSEISDKKRTGQNITESFLLQVYLFYIILDEINESCTRPSTVVLQSRDSQE